MKRKIIIITLFASLMLVALSSYSMILASIDVPTCGHCGACWGSVGEPYFLHQDGGAGWGKYETTSQWDMRFYAYPTCEHQDIIPYGIEICPCACINVS